MSFQAYIDTIKAKTGLDPADFKKLAHDKGLLADGVKPAQIVAWLSEDYDLGRGHAMALVATFKPEKIARSNQDDVIAKQFAGAKAHWQPVYEDLLSTLRETGPVEIAATHSYISLLKGAKKFAIVAVTADRLDVGIKLRGTELKGTEPTERFELSGSWNSMVTHRARVTAPDQIDGELLDWLARAYEAA